jgi:hypothetical protein
MPKGKQDPDVELNFDADDRETTGTDANPIDAATGEPLFDDLSPRFTRQLDAAADKARGKPSTPKPKDLDEDDLDDDLDREEELDEDEDEDEDRQGRDDSLADEEDEDEDADEPRPGRKPTAIEKRIARADRLLEESRAQIIELQRREAQREAQDKLAASEGQFNAFKAETEQKLSDLRRRKVQAMENGETEAAATLDEEIIDLRSELRTREREHDRAKKELEELAKRRPVSAITATKVAQWKRRNPRFESDPEFKAVVIALDQELARGGSNPESDDHYKELDRRLKKLYPEHATRTKVRRHPSQQIEREAAPATRRRTAATVKGGKLTLPKSKLDRIKANMARFGLDSSDPKALRDYILNNPGL